MYHVSADRDYGHCRNCPDAGPGPDQRNTRSREHYANIDDPAGKVKDQTYAEIFDSPVLGLEYKMTQLSQSSRAMLAFLEYRHSNQPDLWPRV